MANHTDTTYKCDYAKGSRISRPHIIWNCNFKHTLEAHETKTHNLTSARAR